MTEATGPSAIPQLPMTAGQLSDLLDNSQFIYQPVIKELMWQIMEESGNQPEAEVKDRKIEQLKAWNPSSNLEGCCLAVLCHKISLWIQKVWHQLRLLCSTDYADRFEQTKAGLLGLYEQVGEEYGRLEQLEVQRKQALLQQLTGQLRDLQQECENLQQSIDQPVVLQGSGMPSSSSSSSQTSSTGLLQTFMSMFSRNAQPVAILEQQVQNSASTSYGLISINEMGLAYVEIEKFKKLIDFVSLQEGVAETVLEKLVGVLVAHWEAPFKGLEAVIQVIQEHKEIIDGWAMAQKRHLEQQCVLIGQQIAELEAEGVTLPSPLEEELSTHEDIAAEGTSANRFSAVENRMLLDIAQGTHPEVAQIWQLLLQKCYDSGQFPQGVIRAWDLRADGEFTMRLHQPITMWVNSEEFAARGGVLMKYGANPLKQIRGVLVNGALPDSQRVHEGLVTEAKNDPEKQNGLPSVQTEGYVGILYHYEGSKGDVESYLQFMPGLWPTVGLRHMLRMGDLEVDKKNFLITGTGKAGIFPARSKGALGSYAAYERSWGDGVILPTTNGALTTDQCKTYIGAQAAVYQQVERGQLSREEANTSALASIYRT